MANRVLAFAASLLIWAPTSATAQSGGADPAASEQQKEGKNDIIITARKRRERLQDAPVSVTAFGEEDMARRGITSVAELARRVPSLNYGDFGDAKLSPTSLRGIVSSAGSAGADPAVGFYVDEVYVGQGAGATLDLYDIERVEVLRGPQGTLFGRNTIGGVVSLTTKRPSETLTASGQAVFGNFGRYRLAGSLSGPIVGDRVLGKIALIRDRRGGYDRNLFLNRRVNDHDAWSGRAQILARLGADTQLLLTGSSHHLDQETLVFETLKYNPAALVPQLLTGAGFPLNLDPFDRRVIANEPSEERLTANQLSARLETAIGDVQLTNVAAWQKHRYYSRTDTCRCQLRISYDGDPEVVERFSNELRLSGTAGSLGWVVGAYYFRQDSDNQSFIELGSDLADLFGEPSIAGLVIGSSAEMRTTSQALFASLDVPLADTVDLSLGARYTRETKAIDYVQTDPLALLGGPVALVAKDSWDRLTPNLSVRYRPNSRLTLYAAASNGFKSGGFNDALGSANGISFGPESLWNYEVGVKSTWMGGRVTVNLAAFLMDWNKIQILVQNPATTFFDPIILNAGGASSRGLELEVNARPTDNLRLGLAASKQRARYSEGTLPDGRPLEFIPYAPSYTLSTNAEYRIPIRNHFVALSGEYIARGRTYLTTNNDPDGRVGAYGLLNLRLSVADAGERWQLSLFGDNLTDATYRTRLFDLFENPLNGQKFITLGPPRTFGVEFRIRFE
jgi:iron complex outermembrane receptor protein